MSTMVRPSAPGQIGSGEATFKVEQRSERRDPASLLRRKVARAVPERPRHVVLASQLDIADHPPLSELVAHRLANILGDGVLVQFMVAGRDDVEGDGGEEVEGGDAFDGGGVGVDEAVAVDAVARVDEEQVDSASARFLFQAVGEGVKVWNRWRTLGQFPVGSEGAETPEGERTAPVSTKARFVPLMAEQPAVSVTVSDVPMSKP